MFFSYALETPDNLVADYHLGCNSDFMPGCVSFSMCLVCIFFTQERPFTKIVYGKFQENTLFCYFTLCNAKNIFLGCDLAIN